MTSLNPDTLVARMSAATNGTTSLHGMQRMDALLAETRKAGWKDVVKAFDAADDSDRTGGYRTRLAAASRIGFDLEFLAGWKPEKAGKSIDQKFSPETIKVNELHSATRPDDGPAAQSLSRRAFQLAVDASDPKVVADAIRRNPKVFERSKNANPEQAEKELRQLLADAEEHAKAGGFDLGSNVNRPKALVAAERRVAAINSPDGLIRLAMDHAAIGTAMNKHRAAMFLPLVRHIIEDLDQGKHNAAWMDVARAAQNAHREAHGNAKGKPLSVGVLQAAIKAAAETAANDFATKASKLQVVASKQKLVADAVNRLWSALDKLKALGKLSETQLAAISEAVEEQGIKAKAAPVVATPAPKAKGKAKAPAKSKAKAKPAPTPDLNQDAVAAAAELTGAIPS